MRLTLLSDGQWLKLIGTLPKQFNALIRDSIKLEYRNFNTEEKVWYVHYTFLPQIVKLAQKYFQVVDRSQLPPEWQYYAAGAQPPEITTEAEDLNPYEVLFVTPSAPEAVIKAAYRALAQIYHPDKGGDASKMQMVNEAYNKICKIKK